MEKAKLQTKKKKEKKTITKIDREAWRKQKAKKKTNNNIITYNKLKQPRSAG